MTWQDALTAELKAIREDVDTKAVRKVFNQWAKQRQPAKEVSPHTRLIDLWCSTFEARFGFKYAFKGKDAKAVQSLLAVDYGPKVSDPVAHLMRIAQTAWDHKDSYPCSMSLTLPKLLSHINEIREWLNELRKGKQAAPKGAVPLFKQLEIVKEVLANHPCNPRSIAYNPDSASMKGDYTELKRKLQSLEQEQRKRVVG